MSNSLRNVAKRAIKAAGGGARLSRALGLTRQAVYLWKHVPVDHVLVVEQVTGIPRHDLRPDIYPPHRERHGLGPAT
jgi:DNA-binding transcriptional regulator YdaS (Cro superfamily)